MKSFKQEHLYSCGLSTATIEYSFIQVQSTYIVTSTAQTDLGLRSRTFSQKLIS